MDDDALRELFRGLGPVTIKPMFGGKGVYHRGTIVGVSLKSGDVFLKGDAVSGLALANAGGRRWTYEGQKGLVKMPYWSIPETALDDPDELAHWTRQAYDAALRAGAPKPAFDDEF